MKLKDKVAIVTGSSKGIGLGIARVFAREGARVAVVCRTEERGIAVRDELLAQGSEAVFIPADVTNSEAIQNMVRETIAAFGQLDILVNNAGYHISKSVEDVTEEEWEFIQNTNLRSTFLCSKYAIPELRKTKGNIINISSMVGVVGQPNAGAYSATKGGQIAMSKGMAIDFAADGIRVNVICPGWIATPLVEDWFSQQEDQWKLSDPYVTFPTQCLQEEILSQDEIQNIQKQAEQAVAIAVESCTTNENGQLLVCDELWPDLSGLTTGLRSDGKEFQDIEYCEFESFTELEEVVYSDAIAAVTGRHLENDDRVFVLGEEIANFGGGPYGATKSLPKK